MSQYLFFPLCVLKFLFISAHSLKLVPGKTSTNLPSIFTLLANKCNFPIYQPVIVHKASTADSYSTLYAIHPICPAMI